ncbi:MAG TPA: PDZ domain-containing protein [Chromatiales bacterium]|nr:PDZ domain-containing protein [Chromatiales bacterium]
MKRLLFIASMTVILWIPAAFAASPAMEAGKAGSEVSKPGIPYLGVAIDSLPQAVAKQLPSGVSQGEGVMVVNVAPDSPADQGGIQGYDILIGYGDQKLYSPEQLTKLVQNDQVGRQVPIKLVRGGKVMEVTVTLGSRPAGFEPRGMTPHPVHPRPRFMPPWEEAHPPSISRPKRFIESFEALSITKTADDRYKVVVDYLAEEGVKKHLEFEGTRDEINALIREEQTLPPRLKRQLLQGLNSRGGMFMPPMFLEPFDRPFFDRFMERWPDRF